MGLLDRLHGGYVFKRRIGVLSRRLALLLPADASTLDVGCGDGSIAKRILELRRDVRIEGIDVLVRQQTHIPVSPFDGKRIPHPDRSFDVVMFVDVLHHTEDPMELLREARRVARSAIVIKDHCRDGLGSAATLRFMDWVGNARHGVVLSYNYWPAARWAAAFEELGLVAEEYHPRPGLYPIPANLLFDRSLHFLARLAVP